MADGYLMRLGAIDNHRSTMGGTHMEEHLLGVVSLVVVAVDAVVVVGVEGTVVLVDDRLLEVGEVALVEAQLAVELVAGFYESVAQIRVNLFLGHREREGGIADPAGRAVGKDGDGEVLAFCIG